MNPLVIKPCTFEYLYDLKNEDHLSSRIITVPQRVQAYINYAINQKGTGIYQVSGSLLLSALGYFRIEEDSFNWISRQGFSKPISLTNKKTLRFGWLKQDTQGCHSMLIASFPHSDDRCADGLQFHAPYLSDSNAPEITDYHDLAHLSKQACIKKLDKEYKRYFQYINEKLKDWKPE